MQCDSGHLNGDLIACARYRIYDERVKAIKKNEIQQRGSVTHVLFIINLPHQIFGSSFVGFQGDPWISYHIDDLRASSGDTIEPLHAISSTISDLFIGRYIHDIQPALDITVSQLLNKPPAESKDSVLDNVAKLTEFETPTTSEVNADEAENGTIVYSESNKEEVEGYTSAQTDSVEGAQVVSHFKSSGAKDELLPLNSLTSSEDSEEDEKQTSTSSSHSVTSEEVMGQTDNGQLLVSDEYKDIVTQVRPFTIQMEDTYAQLEPGDDIFLDQPCVAQCRRLYGSIQAAVSKLENTSKDRSTQRVVRLTRLIPKDLPEHIGIID